MKKVTRKAFMKWLRKGKNKNRKFCVSDTHSCPLAEFLLDTIPGVSEVDVDTGRMSVNKIGGEEVSLGKPPKWAEKFMEWFDSFNRGKSYKVSGKRILKALDAEPKSVF